MAVGTLAGATKLNNDNRYDLKDATNQYSGTRSP